MADHRFSSFEASPATSTNLDDAMLFSTPQCRAPARQHAGARADGVGIQTPARVGAMSPIQARSSEDYSRVSFAGVGDGAPSGMGVLPEDGRENSPPSFDRTLTFSATPSDARAQESNGSEPNLYTEEAMGQEAPETATGGSGAEDDEEDESLALARRLMEEDRMLAYRELQQASVHFALNQMQGGEDVEDEDLALSLRLMQEEVRDRMGTTEDLAAFVNASRVADEDEDGEGDGEGSDHGDNEEIDIDNMQYEDLVELGRTLGDVKTERWAIRSARVISQLRTVHVQQDGGLPLEQSNDPFCPICRCDYEANESVLVLPCQHAFHKECAAEWLKEHWDCPLCKQHVAPSPERPGQAESRAAEPAPSP